MATAPTQPVTPAPPATVVGRTAEDRLALVARVVSAARSELCQRQDLSVRAVARRAGVDPSQVVRQVGPRPELVRRVFFEMAVDAHETMAAVSSVSANAGCRDRLLAYAHGYRHWALAHPVEFALILGPASRPLMDETVAAQGIAWFYAPLFEILRDGHARGEIDPSSARSGARVQPAVRPVLLAAVGDLDPALVLAFVTLSAGMHGYLMLEGCGQLDAMFVDTDRAYDAHVRALADAAGIR